jgi:predicted alpha-1,2-mannosidase
MPDFRRSLGSDSILFELVRYKERIVMMKFRLFEAAILLLLIPKFVFAQSLADLVNPLVGTAAEGQTFPGAGMPFGMTQWTPATQDTESKGVVPYYFADGVLHGIRGTHFASGSAMQDYGSFQLFAGSGEFAWQGHAPSSRFSHDAEHATPYIYQVELPDLDALVSATGTTRCGMLRFVFHKGETAWIDVQNNARAGDGLLTVDSKRNEITGWSKVRRLYAGQGKLAGFSGYVVVEFDHPFHPGGTWSGSKVHPGSVQQASDASPSGSYVIFEVKPGESVMARVGTSFVSIDEARKNLRTEIPTWNFEKVEQASHAAWDKALGAIEVSGDNADRRIFYTAMYHSLQLPRIFSDASGTYPRFAGGEPIETARGFTYYDDFSIWDTFRAVHPLFTIIDPKRDVDMIRSLVVKGKQDGFLPTFPVWNSDTAEMDGDHEVTIIGDAYLKGIRGFDIREAYRLMRKNALESPASEAEYLDGKGRRALDSYLKYGYIPLEDSVPGAPFPHRNEQVSRTLDYAYDDFVLAEVAKALGKPDDEAMFRKRAQNYRNVIDPSTGFARGRHADGSWVTPFDPTKPATYVTEGLPFQYTFYVLQDIPGLIALEHGNTGFISKLDELFAKNLYDQSNEPSHQIAYLYDYAGAAFKTQQHVAEVRAAGYKDQPGGLAGNDDAGQMSAWYILSALGFYQVTPGIPRYTIGSPLFPDAKIHLPNGEVFHIVVHRDSAQAIYVQSATLNGQPLRRFWLTHAEIASGGTLIVHMSCQANPHWPSKANKVNGKVLAAVK